MDRIESIDVDPEDFYPEPGFFSRSHTEKYIGSTDTALSPHAYAIDGQWTASDFSRFYSKLADLYALFSIVQEAANSVKTSLDLDSIITAYPFQGGGSYLSMFRDVIAGSNDNYPLRVSKIKYASPGIIEVKGILDSLLLIDDLVITFSKSSKNIGEIASTLRETLKRDGVLGSATDHFSNAATEKLAIGKVNDLLAAMRIENHQVIQDACRGRPVVYAKIGLAIHRRGEEFHRFRAQGRMQLT